MNSIYATPSAADGSIAPTWFASAGIAAPTGGVIPTTRPVADNIVALIISPRREATNDQEPESATGPTSIANDYNYDSSVIDNATSTSPQGTQHLLPPLIRVVLIAIDDKSAQRLEQLNGSDGTPPLGDDLAPVFINAYELDEEVKEVVTILQTQKLNYRVFSATVQLRGAKWSI